MLQVETIKQLDAGTGKLIEEWGELAVNCPTATVFQTPQWLATWWDIFGRKSKTRRLCLLTARDQGKLIGLLPMMCTNWHLLPQQRLAFLGAGVTDYNDALAINGRGSEVCEAFYAYLGSEYRHKIIDFRELRDGGLLRENPPPRTSGFTYGDWPLENCPFISLPRDGRKDERWNELLRGYSKKFRSSIGYSERTLRRAFQVDIRAVDNAAELPQALDDLYELHQRRWNQRWLPGVFTNKRVRAFHSRATALLLAQGWLRLYLLRLDDQVQAALYAFAFNNRTCYYQGGFEPELARYSLGSQLIAHAVRQAIDEEFSTFDFLRGNEEYKMRWTQEARKYNVRRLITSSSAQLALAETAHQLENGLETKLKSILAGGVVRRAPKQRGASSS